ncbi:hypothetical protein TGME49_221880 [Toxoplasma gondii ME49]|uniref:WD domain, G-beta repeat-containing protein n=2 Tax=Toxoplasma gondii TaxID=5811 RepID=S8F809_TOXGM|nr:hypothetical protein TGME49_221880 [Toxoplasma gondii ME49]EPT32021.1 hypothetical protein TGME49_221880 [Toxoplasma gondii ME49]KYF42635.1 hypothetical protein TGARI_221880 [Toxoplasma gondii ARI]|eukprot:XP_018638290.1 hypothetical protein TGME49_221880 [Toxoplasma gondii ME49]
MKTRNVSESQELVFTYRRKLKLGDAEDVAVPVGVTAVKFNTVQPEKTELFTADEKGFLRCWSYEHLLSAGRLRSGVARLSRRPCASPPTLHVAPFSCSAGEPDGGGRESLERRLARRLGDRVDVVSLQMQQWEKALLNADLSSSIDTAHSASTALTFRSSGKEDSGDSSGLLRDESLPWSLSEDSRQPERGLETRGRESEHVGGTDRSGSKREDQGGRGDRAEESGGGQARAEKQEREEKEKGEEEETEEAEEQEEGESGRRARPGARGGSREEGRRERPKESYSFGRLESRAFITQLARGGAAEEAGECAEDEHNRREGRKENSEREGQNKNVERNHMSEKHGCSRAQEKRRTPHRSEVTLLWERAAHADAILTMHLYSSADLSPAGPSSSTANTAPPPDASSCSPPQHRETESGVLSLPAASVPSTKKPMNEERTTLPGTSHSGARPPSRPRADSPQSLKRSRSSPPSSRNEGASPEMPSEGDSQQLDANQNVSSAAHSPCNKKTPWLLTTGADKIVKTWRGDGAPLGKLACDSSRYWTALGNREAHWARRLDQARELLNLLSERFFLQDACSSSCSGSSASSGSSSSPCSSSSARRRLRERDGTPCSAASSSPLSTCRRSASHFPFLRSPPSASFASSPGDGVFARRGRRAVSSKGLCLPRTDLEVRDAADEEPGSRALTLRRVWRAQHRREKKSERRRESGRENEHEEDRWPWRKTFSLSLSREEQRRGEIPSKSSSPNLRQTTRSNSSAGFATHASRTAILRHRQRFNPSRNAPLSEADSEAAILFEECLRKASPAGNAR